MLRNEGGRAEGNEGDGGNQGGEGGSYRGEKRRDN